MRALGWGEDLPAGIARDWREWCSTPGYVESVFDQGDLREGYVALRCPLLNLSATDDSIATEANVEDILRLFPNAAITRVRLDPAALGVAPMGHIDLLRPVHAPQWAHLWSFLNVADAPVSGGA